MKTNTYRVIKINPSGRSQVVKLDDNVASYMDITGARMLAKRLNNARSRSACKSGTYYTSEMMPRIISPARITKHSYEIQVGDGYSDIVTVDADNRSSAAAAAEREGYTVWSVNMVG